MPTFQFNKLIRGAMIPMYDELGQKAVYKLLTGKDLTGAIADKIIEETREIPADGDRAAIVKEIADVRQGVIDLQTAHGISDQEVETARMKKLAEKGGFIEGVFVETLTLRDDDSWVQYYRAEPDKYPETDRLTGRTPTLPLGTYRHYKGNLYDVIGVGCHTESQEFFVVYKPLYKHDGQSDIWLRPYTMFIETVIVDGKTTPRFVKQD